MVEGRVFTPEFRISLAERILNGESVTAVSQQYQIKRSVLYRRRDWVRVSIRIWPGD